MRATLAPRRPSLGLVGFVVIGALALVHASCVGRGRLTPDAFASALEAGDYTGLIRVSGCGHQPQVISGYTYCRVQEGEARGEVTFIAPPEAKECDEPACVDFKIFDPSGGNPIGRVIPKGEVTAVVTWKELLRKDSFAPGDAGFWPYVYTIRWKDKDGRPRKTVSEGEIRLRVYRARVCTPQEGGGETCRPYVPLAEVASDPNFVWDFSVDGFRVKMTTGARTHVAAPEGAL